MPHDLDAFDRLRLPDGRRLAFIERGARDGKPVVYHHGSPSSRIESALFGAAAARAGIRLIAFDRPGMGRSDYRVRWTYPDLARDLAALADHLGLDRFGVLGWSAGGPPALACARLLPERVHRIVLVAPVPFGALDRDRVRGELAPLKRIAGRCAWSFPGALNGLLWPFSAAIRWRPGRFIDAYRIKLCPADRRVLRDPANRAIIEADFKESLRQGVRGYAHDLHRLFNPWGFDPRGIPRPVPIWQGTADTLVRAEFGEALIAILPAAEPRLFEDEGHYLPVPHADELFRLFHTDR